jgi:hypothetical protein
MGMNKLFSGLAMLGALAMAGALSPAVQARDWKPKATTLAQNYAEIVDGSKKGELTVLFWFPSPMFAGKPKVQDMVTRYVIIGAVHAKVSPDGLLLPVHIDALQAQDGTGKALNAVAQDKIPPDVQGFLAAFGGVMSQSLGVVGKGMQYFVFDAGAVNACKKGGMAIPLNGETYTYITPIPGCPAS